MQMDSNKPNFFHLMLLMLDLLVKVVQTALVSVVGYTAFVWSVMIFALLALIFLLGIFLIVKKVQDGNQQQNLPPGPWGLPLLGHLVSLGLNPHLTLIKWKQKYGPIISCRFGGFPTVVLCDSKLIKEAFNMNEFSGRPKIQVYVENNVTKGIGLSDGPYNTELRQFTMRKLKEFGMGRKTLEGKIQEGVSEFMDFIKEREGLPIKSENVPSAHVIKTLWSITMSSEMNPVEIEHLSRIVTTLTSLGPVLSELAGFMPWMENLTRAITFGRFSLTATKASQLHEIYSFFARALKDKEQNGAKGQGQAPIDLMDMFLEKVGETKEESSPFHKSQDSAKYFLGEMFAAGIHTTQTALLWMFNYMARNREVQLKLQEEIDEVIGNGSGNDLSRLPSLADRGQMPYADAIVHEVLRMSSVAPILIPHKAFSDVHFHGYTIKKDTMIFANAYGAHYDPEVWGDPENFRPERWFGEQGKKLKSEHFLPFSTGRRNCPGESLAREQLFLYVTTLFQKYSVNFDHGKVPEVKGVFGLALHPSKFTVVFNQRKINKS